jgi:hypothetical protein
MEQTNVVKWTRPPSLLFLPSVHQTEKGCIWSGAGATLADLLGCRRRHNPHIPIHTKDQMKKIEMAPSCRWWWSSRVTNWGRGAERERERERDRNRERESR